MLYNDDDITSRLTMPDPYTDTNNNNNNNKSRQKNISDTEKTLAGLDKYSLRPRSVRRCRKNNSDLSSSTDEENQAPASSVAAATIATSAAKQSKKAKAAKQKPAPLSKYRRRTANARERCRMKEINQAFETLRRVVPQLSEDSSSTAACNEKLTKITTLRLAMKYISSLSASLNEPASELYSDLDMLLESDGESLPMYSDFSSDRSLTSDFSMDLDGNEDSLNSVDLHLEPFSPDSLMPHHISSFDPFLSGFS